MTALRIATHTPDFFANNGKGAVVQAVGFGCTCANCGREISAPFGYERRLIWCLYCGMQHGYVPMIETPFSRFRWTFGVTREECLEDMQALAAGNFDEVAERRARRYGNIWNLFG